MSQQKVCIHTESNYGCQRPAFTHRTNGWLCIQHYRMQQASMPSKHRLPQPRWKGLPLTRDEDIIADIIQQDAQAIQLGRVVSVRYGALDPVYVRYLES